MELLGKSNFSFLEGASHPEEMILQAQRLGYKGFGLCDRNGVYGVARAFQAVEYPSKFLLEEFHGQKIRFHVGAELLIQREGAPEGQHPLCLSFLPLNKWGYFSLCQLITLSKRRSPKGFCALTLNDLKVISENALALLQPPYEEDDIEALLSVFDNQHLYLATHKDYSWDSHLNYKKALQMEHKYQVSIVATTAPLMHSKERKPLHDVLTCIHHKTTLEKAKTRLTQNSERHLKALSELKALWSDRPDALQRTLELSDRLNFSLHELKYEYPKAFEDQRPPQKILKDLTLKGLEKRFPKGIPPSVMKSVQHELALIAELQYEDYFLTLWDVCQFANSKKILHQGRGSAANSVVCYALELTAVDPTKVRLVFERFLSKERGEPPDIDIDFESGRREEVIQYIYQKYGAEHAAMVCTVICYRSRLALRESAKTLGISKDQVDLLIKYMGREGLTRVQEDKDGIFANKIALEKSLYERWIQIASALVGFPRHLGIHTGGFLISKRPIFECVPVEKASMEGRYVIQWNKDDLNVLKMLKIDVLGLGMLSALQKSFEMLKNYRNIDLSLYSIPHDDKDTYAMIQKADTVGVFQIESRAQMSLLPRLKPKCFYDLVVEVAIVRPGPLQGGMVHPYIRRRHGQEKVEYAHPDLVPILEKTFGVPIFQEQVMQIASSVCGFSPGEADELRRIMSSSWKKRDLMKGLRQRILNGMLEHGIAMEYAEKIYQTIVGFSSYGFPESHAASFALLTYASCYIKQHHPDLFVCSLLNSQPMGFYSPRALIDDAKRHGVRFFDVCIQSSDWDCKPSVHKPLALRLGFNSLYGVPKQEVLKMLEERQRHGAFKDLKDLVRRCPFLRRQTLLKFATAGALKSFQMEPRLAAWKIMSLNINPQSLFFTQSEEGHSHQLLPHEGDWDFIEREYQSKGFSIHRHPMDLFRKQLDQERPRSLRAKDLERTPGGRNLSIAGLLALHQRPPTAKGFSFLTMEDETGSFNVILTPDIYEKYRLDLVFYPLLKIHGRIEKKSGVIHIKAQHLEPLKPPQTA